MQIPVHKKVSGSAIVIIGAAGDLAKRKLMARLPGVTVRSRHSLKLV